MESEQKIYRSWSKVLIILAIILSAFIICIFLWNVEQYNVNSLQDKIKTFKNEAVRVSINNEQINPEERLKLKKDILVIEKDATTIQNGVYTPLIQDDKVIDLRAVNLVEVEIQSADLSGANLTVANLSGADLSKAILIRANLSGSILTCANFIGADLSKAILSHADLRGAKLTDTDLSDTDLIQANLNDANLRGADLNNANFSHTLLLGADLSTSKNLTQNQLMLVAKNENTKLPDYLNIPIA